LHFENRTNAKSAPAGTTCAQGSVQSNCDLLWRLRTEQLSWPSPSYVGSQIIKTPGKFKSDPIAPRPGQSRRRRMLDLRIPSAPESPMQRASRQFLIPRLTQPVRVARWRQSVCSRAHKPTVARKSPSGHAGDPTRFYGWKPVRASRSPQAQLPASFAWRTGSWAKPNPAVSGAALDGR
jgi:hypothetical protein